MSSSFWRLDEEEIFRKRIRRSEILSCGKDGNGTNRTQEGLEERKGMDTEEQVESWVLQKALKRRSQCQFAQLCVLEKRHFT